ncbi:MAG: nucleoside phosphorylase [Gemmatimonadetes bacterium]|nr:nucleoside phosphorylase [Gemmatimonadota bacterium]
MNDDELLHARDVLTHRWTGGAGPRGEPPQGVILCHQAGMLGSALARWRTRRVGGFEADLRMLRRTGGRIAVATRFGVGGPAAVALLEELVAFGVPRFISIGMAGGLRERSRAGDLIVAKSALRADGTSAHYLPAGRAAEPSAGVTRQLASALERRGHPYLAAPVCTTDAPYRTTRAAVEHWTRAGGVAVEMEAAGLFAAGQLRGVEVAAACCVADGLSQAGWRLDFNHAAVAAGMRCLLAAAIEALDQPRNTVA